MHNLPATCLAVLLMALCASPAISQEKAKSTPDAANGLRLAKALCVNCHVVGPASKGPATTSVPTFAEMANRPGQSYPRLTKVLMAPHPGMPNARLTRAEITDLIAYLDTLRAPKAGPPLLPKIEPAPKKPENPKQG